MMFGETDMTEDRFEEELNMNNTQKGRDFS